MSIKLSRFKVSGFRSIEESDWIDVSDNTCLVGTNEAGKTNLLIALWKLNPASGEPINPLVDFPRHLYSNYKAEKHEEDVFICADFILDENYQKQVAQTLQCDLDQVKTVLICRKYNGTYSVTFPYSKVNTYETHKLIAILDKFQSQLNIEESFLKEPIEFQNKIQFFLSELKEYESKSYISKSDVEDIIAAVKRFSEHSFGKKKNLPDFFQIHFLEHLSKLIEAFDGKPVSISEEIQKEIIIKIPKFVYYSDYGNLDSEIFLPRVIEDFERTDLPESARAKVRTLRVLFRYVNLSPQEIYELGNDRRVIIKKYNYNNQLTDETEQDVSEAEVQQWADKKKERGILLRSAADQLTQRFKKWWLQGDYVFSFEADGNHFRINVSDSLRTEQIELEGRSRGLQWFFSFFLVFLVETKGEHSNSILLLDEPGLSLHPLAQFDLAKFFRKLSEDNQLVYTSHSPFLVDMDNLGNVKAVYVDSQSGRTKVSSNLKYNEVDAAKSIYPVHAALGLTVSETLLLGCIPILVEGPSDQIYLSLIKRFLIGTGDLQNSREIVFIPTGGIRGMSAVTKLVSSRDDKLPFILLDSDRAGKEYQRQLVNGRYKDEKDKVLEVAQFLADGEFEIEDLLPATSLVKIIDRMFRSENYFEDSYKTGIPIVNQIQDWAKHNSITLPEGWKVDVARKAHNQFDKLCSEVSTELKEKWKLIFSNF